MCLHYSHPIYNNRILLIRLLNRTRARATTSITEEIRDKGKKKTKLSWLTCEYKKNRTKKTNKKKNREGSGKALGKDNPGDSSYKLPVLNSSFLPEIP